MSQHWDCYRVAFRAESPVHIGWHELGFVQRTRYYVPARNIWGALVAGLAPLLPEQPSVEGLYAKAQQEVGRLIRATYFFPAPDPDGQRMWAPHFEEGGRWLGDLRESEFERRFLTSQAATALDPSRLSAETGALHESEFLSPRGHDGEPLFFVGYLLARETADLDLFRRALGNCRVGAERGYGWGRLTLFPGAWKVSETVFGVFRVHRRTEGEDPALTCCEHRAVLPAHMHYRPGVAKFEGDLEPVAGREWEPHRGSGQAISEARLCWVPGCRTRDDADARRIEFSILERGLWDARNA